MQPGDKVPADIRIFFGKNLFCNESVLTGESFPVLKQKEPSELEAFLFERSSMAYSGTFITSGNGYGIVVAIGKDTEFGKIASLVQGVDLIETPMTKSLKKIALAISYTVGVASVFLFFVGFLRGNLFFDAVFSAATLAVAAIPEGIPAIITIACSIGVRRLAQKNVMIRQLPALESLGSVNIICTDKTGTLTSNEMTVQQIWSLSGSAFVSGVGYGFEGSFITSSTAFLDEMDEILKAFVLCSTASLEENSEGILFNGDPTELAIIIAAKKRGITQQIRSQHKVIDFIPFDSDRKIMASLHEYSLHQHLIIIKGAPEEIVKLCSDSCVHCKILQQAHQMASEGMRVLAIARQMSPFTESRSLIDKLDRKAEFIGLVGLIDPPRKEVYLAIKKCHEAGIDVKMITGDHPATASSIARDIGILGNSKVITGHDLSLMDENTLLEKLANTHVFARVAPDHKLKLVECLQKQGHVVAMTGDGVNDAAALRRADVGISMGLRGTAIAQEASDMILIDDNFASIEVAIEEGRRVYDNLIKSITFVFPTSLGQAMIILGAIIFFPIEQGILLHPISPIQILWINLVVAIALALPLAFEPADPLIMKRSPRKDNFNVCNFSILLKIFYISFVMAAGSICLFLWNYNWELKAGSLQEIALAKSQTMAMTLLMFFQLLYLFNCRSVNLFKSRGSFFSNIYLFVGIIFVIIAQLLLIYSKYMNQVFHTYPLDISSWMICLLASFAIIPVFLVEKRALA